MIARNQPSFKEELKFIESGLRLIAGVDEVGRGCLAGPVVASAVILPCSRRVAWISGVRDSKLLSAKQREALFEVIRQKAVAAATGIVWQDVIDDIGIAPASRLAMKQAIDGLHPAPDGLLVDYFKLPEVELPQNNVVHGDRLCFSIACASIVAKVTRDRLMRALDNEYRGYGLANHKGYATREHCAALEKLGLAAIHRRSFCGFILMRLETELE
jgi:ribonuclease HII